VNASGPASTGATIRPAWRSPRAWAFLGALTLLGLLADLGSKSLAFRHVADQPVRIDRADVIALTAQRHGLAPLLPFHDPMVVVPHVLEFQLVLNKGAVFGLGAGQRWVFVLFTGAAICLGLWAFGRWTDTRDRLSHASIGLVLAGGLGNVYDRLVFACVRDFIHPLPGVALPFGWHWPNDPSGEVWPWVSNVADLFLILGVAGLMLAMWRQPAPRAGGPATGATHAPGPSADAPARPGPDRSAGEA